jgi:hypothetical protein
MKTLPGTAEAAQLPSAHTALREESGPQAFRFLDLPPELRNHVYAYAMASTKMHDLRDVREPALAAVSVQVRNEVLPIFFAESCFSIVVASDYVTGLGTQYAHVVRERGTGTLGIKRSVMKHLNKAGNTVVIRDITFIAGRVRWVKSWRCDGGFLRYADHPQLSLRCLQTHGKAPSIVVGRTYPGHRLRIFGPALEKAGAIAEELALRDAFIGFTITDLMCIGHGFRLSKKI